MRIWSRFLKTLESGGGALVILLLLIILFAMFAKWGFASAEEQLYLILGALIGILKGGGGKSGDKSSGNEKEKTE